MALYHSAAGVTKSLRVHLDPNSPQNFRSDLGQNLLSNAAFQGGVKVTQEGGSNAVNTIIQLPNPGDSPYVLAQTPNGTAYETEYEMNVYGLTASTTYCLSGWYAVSNGWSGNHRMFHSRAVSSSGANNSLGVGIGTLIDSRLVNGITWEFRYALLTTPSDATGQLTWYCGYSNTNDTYTGARYYTNLKIEKGSFPSMKNLTNDGTSSYTYTGYTNGSNGIVSTYNGSTQFTDITPAQQFDIHSIEVWMYNNNSISGDGAIGGPSTYQTLMSWNNQAGVPGVSLGGWTGAMTNETIHIWSNGTTGGPGATYINTSVPVGWHHVAFNWNSSSNYYDIWLDGVKQTVLALSGNDGHCKLLQDITQIRIGANTDVGYYFNGSLGPVKYYESPLTDSEILQNFNSLKRRFGL